MPNGDIENCFIETAGEIAESFSINRVVGQLYAFLYISPEPVSLDDMAKKLKISKGSASVNIRILEGWNAVKKIWVQGSRKDYYTAETDFLKILLERLDHGVTRRMRYMDEKLDLINKMLDQKDPSKKQNNSDFYKKRLEQIIEVRHYAQKFLKFLPKVKQNKNLRTLFSLLN